MAIKELNTNKLSIPKNQKRFTNKNNVISAKTKINYSWLRFKELLLQRVVLFGSLALFSILIILGSIYSSSQIQKLDRVTITDTYSLIVILFSLFNVTLVVFGVWKFFHLDVVDGQTKLELRSGFTPLFMYFYRLFLILLFIFALVLIEFSLSGIFFAIAKDKNEDFAYRLFLSPILWFVFISLLGMFLALFFMVLIRTKIALAFSLIVSIFFLLMAPLGIHFNQIKVNPSPVNIEISQTTNQKFISANVIKIELNEGNYVEIGEEFYMYQELFSAIKNYGNHDFLSDNSIGNLASQGNHSILPIYLQLLDIGRRISQDKNNYEKDLINELKGTRDSLLVSYAVFWERKTLLSSVSKLIGGETGNDWLLKTFSEDLNKAKALFRDGIQFDEWDLTQDYLKMWSRFNKKMTMNSFFNPLYQLNLLFFGPHSNPSRDNLMNTNRPLFTQALNMRYNINFKKMPSGAIEFEGARVETYLIESVDAQQNASVGSIFVGYVVIIFLFSGAICITYRPKK